jgi:hypothetical protein
MAKPKRARTERREANRAAVKDAKAGLKLSALEAGGAADRPIVVVSASVIEPHAASIPCAACGAGVRVEEHRAEASLRIVRVRCPRCGVARELYFRIAQLN